MIKKDGNPFSFLIVDDSRFARSSLIKLVEQVDGNVIGEAASGAEARSARHSGGRRRP